MGIFNDNHRNPHTSNTRGQTGLPGKQGPLGVGYKLTADGNYDIDNKQLKNIKDGTDNNDAVNKNQMEHYIENGDLGIPGSINFRRGSISIDGINSQISAADLNKLYPTSANNIIIGKVPIYSSLGSLYCDRLKLRNSNKFVYIKPNQQASNNTIIIPNLGGADRNMMFTSTHQTIRDTQTFQEPIICNKQPTQNSHLTRKDYVDNELNTKVANLVPRAFP